MAAPGRAARRAGLLIGAPVLSAAVLSAGLVFGATDDTRRTGEGSEWYEALVEPVMHDADPDPAGFGVPRRPDTFGLEGTGVHTLVLYDTQGPRPESYELDGIAAANLATHFGLVTAEPLAGYEAGDMTDYEAVIYLGSSHEEEIPPAFAEDVLAGGTPVLWAGANVRVLGGEEGSAEARTFVEEFGWDAAATALATEDRVTAVRYRDTELERDERIEGFLHRAPVLDDERVEILGQALCGSVAEPAECRGAEGTSFPWALRSRHLTYVAEVPFDYMDENSRYLAWADLYYDLLAPEIEPVQRAAVRLEDVGPESDPEDLRRVADLLHERGVPFQVALFPVHVAKVPGSDPTRWYAISLHETPEVVDALRYMEERGGTIIQHGTTHQYGGWDNPYSGQSGADYEFFRAYCSATGEPPYELEDCERDSWVRLTGAVSRDAVGDHAERLSLGREIIEAVGLRVPDTFEVPHYAASPHAYEAIAEGYDHSYERVQYFAGLLSAEQYGPETAITQFFPYRVHDVYGQTVLPENLGNISEEWQNNHPPRDAAFIVRNAELNLAVRESTASFFFHPFLDTAHLDEVLTGIEELGYEFVPVRELP